MSRLSRSLLLRSMETIETLIVHEPFIVHELSFVMLALKESGRRYRRRCCVGVNGIARTTMNFIASA
jgi:hypothetical protein